VSKQISYISLNARTPTGPILASGMRKFVLAAACLSLVGLPAVSQAEPGGGGQPPAAPGDGCLVVSNAYGTISVQAKGVIFGRFNQGQVTITDLNPQDKNVPKVWGSEDIEPAGKGKTRYRGDQVRFRFTGGGPFKLTVTATAIDLSVIGRGSASLSSSGLLQSGGSYSADAKSFCSKNVKPFPEQGTVQVQIGPGGNG